jgi:hypothetical protein
VPQDLNFTSFVFDEHYRATLKFSRSINPYASEALLFNRSIITFDFIKETTVSDSLLSYDIEIR